MIGQEELRELIRQYESHGWKLRIVLTGSAQENDPALVEVIGSNIPLRTSHLDALWFSRPNKVNETWELRRIGSLPYALVRFVSDEDTEASRDEILQTAEDEMSRTVLRPIGN